MNDRGSWRRAWPACWVLLTVMSALTLGLTFAHLLELPQRLQYGADLWTTLTRPNALYRYFGVIGGPLEVATVAGLIVAGIAVRRHPAGRRVIASAIFHAAALIVWLTVVAPANAEIGGWGAAAGIPPGWENWRLRWESGHALSFVLLLAGFCLLVSAALPRRSASSVAD